MFGYIVKNIRERYTIEELSKKYGINLPCRNKNEALITCVDGSTKVEGNFYELNNKKKFSKEKGEKATINIMENKEGVLFESRLGWLAKLIAMILAFIDGIKNAIYNFFMNLLMKIPESIRNIFKIFVFTIMLPLVIIGLFFAMVRKITSAPGGIMGIILAIPLYMIMFVILIFIEIIGILLAPVMNKIADLMMDKPFVRKMVIGSFALDNRFPEGIVVSSALVDSVEFELRKNLLGKENMYVVINEGSKEVSLKDKLLSFILPDYFVNRQTVFATKPEYQAQFENLFNK